MSPTTATGPGRLNRSTPREAQCTSGAAERPAGDSAFGVVTASASVERAQLQSQSVMVRRSCAHLDTDAWTQRRHGADAAAGLAGVADAASVPNERVVRF